MPRLTISEAEAAAAEALAAYARSKSRVDAYTGALRGDLFAKRTQAWRAATLQLDRAACQLRLARIHAYLAERRARVERGQG